MKYSDNNSTHLWDKHCLRSSLLHFTEIYLPDDSLSTVIIGPVAVPYIRMQRFLKSLWKNHSTLGIHSQL